MMLRLLAASSLLAIAGAAAWYAFSSARPYQVDAYFVSAARMVPGSDVTLEGVRVGSVASVRLAPDDQSGAGAIVTLQIDARHAPLRRGTQATIRPKGLLGTMFVDLSPGQGAPIPSGGTLPVQDTAAPVTLDQVEDIFDPQTRAELHTLIGQGGQALAGRGPDVNHVLRDLPQTSADTASTTAVLDQHDQQLDQLLVEFDQVADMISSEDRSLRGDLDNGADLLDTLAAHQQTLQDEIVQADTVLYELNGGLSGHEEDLNQTLRELPDVLDTLHGFEGTSTTTFATVSPCVGDIVNTLAEIHSATAYRDAGGYMLRVDPQVVGPVNGSFNPRVPCSGDRGGGGR
jgi:phospholipid/cholesterol/gamma-HCH transport system substrate-binding protein